ncbi:insulinase family protein [Leptospira wolffii]|uniref:Insulinase family protein n=1 Tax=Leptospira wolffii TaxID=409998 RepID=A0A2M9ZGZ9_9LEPT|nr:pitrilysin family protein [Leptospira wolffii]EPG64167.1 peptidase M16 inactive domain protein [Leptospira wolffii serovar Khorat str. Khorat-H2]PJZ67685.1 insulinase family protein [Leptospira wolffii]TGK62695.1 insulinase family protein [Leptospira wolffii]TGK73918.1 insulinase family protein [Leptospira wolffii]TGK75073.1 insulinase family protein [Leptospira wolffii]
MWKAISRYRTLRFLSILISLLCFLGADISANEDIFLGIRSSLESRVKKVVLKNGIRLLMMKREGSPTVAVYTKFLVGAADETPDIAGTAHLLEHMLFKGTKNIGVNNYEKEKVYLDQIRVWGKRLDSYRLEERRLIQAGEPVPEKLITEKSVLETRFRNLLELHRKFVISNEDSYIYDKNGGTGFNAYTTNDVTNYQILLPANRLEIWAKLESDRLKNPILREYYTERDVVLEERRMRVENQGMGILREKFLGAAFQKHSYGMPVIGYEENLPFLDIDKTEAFFRKNYRPGNMAIGIVGDLDFSQTEALVRKYFEDIPDSSPSPIPQATESFDHEPRRVSVTHSSGPMKAMGWLTPASPHPDRPVLDLIDAILSQGETGRLYKRLVLRDKLAQKVSCWTGEPGERYANLFAIYVTNVRGADPSKIESAILEEIETLKREPVTEEELSKIKNQIVADYIRGLNSNSKLADVLTYYELVAGDWTDIFDDYSRLDRVTPEDIMRVSKQYFVPRNLTVGDLFSSEGEKK